MTDPTPTQINLYKSGGGQFFPIYASDLHVLIERGLTVTKGRYTLALDSGRTREANEAQRQAHLARMLMDWLGEA